MAKLKRIFLSPPHMSGEEMKFIQEAFEGNYIAPTGPQVDAFEREFTEKVGISHAVALSSGTAAMHLALRVLGVASGDEVIASTLTFIGSVSPIVFQGATPVLLDSDRTSWAMDPDLLAEELNACHKRGRLPKAVIPTDLYGQCADLDRILEICEPYGIPVVADSAEALGAKYQKSEIRSQRSEIRDEKSTGLRPPTSGAMLASGRRLLFFPLTATKSLQPPVVGCWFRKMNPLLKGPVFCLNRHVIRPLIMNTPRSVTITE